MNFEINQQPEMTVELTNIKRFPPLEFVTQPIIPTMQAAFYVNRKPQTLRAWACFENGPIRPVRINGRLAWSVSDIKKILSGGAAI